MIAEAIFSTGNDEWETPADLYSELDKEFHFTLDPCCTHENAKHEHHYTKEENGLIQCWQGETVFCNPPYSRKGGQAAWIKKAHDEWAKGDCAVVMLLPARTDTKSFHGFIYGKAELRFLKGRVRFGGSKQGAPFPSMVVVFGKGN